MRRIQITLSDRIAEELDKTAGARKRSGFISKAVEEKLARTRFICAVDEALQLKPWKDKDHPELSGGSAAYAQNLRKKDSITLFLS